MVHTLNDEDEIGFTMDLFERANNLLDSFSQIFDANFIHLGMDKELTGLKAMMTQLGLEKQVAGMNILEIQVSMGKLKFTKRWSFTDRFEMMDRKLYKRAETIKGRFNSNNLHRNSRSRQKDSVNYGSNFGTRIQNERSTIITSSPQHMDWRNGIKKYANNTKLKKIDLVSKTDILKNDCEFHKDHKYTRNCSTKRINRTTDKLWEEEYDTEDIEDLLKFSDLTLDLDFFDNQKISEEAFCSLINNSA